MIGLVDEGEGGALTEAVVDVARGAGFCCCVIATAWLISRRASRASSSATRLHTSAVMRFWSLTSLSSLDRWVSLITWLTQLWKSFFDAVT